MVSYRWSALKKDSLPCSVTVSVRAGIVTVPLPGESSTLHSGARDSQEVAVERMNKGAGRRGRKSCSTTSWPSGCPRHDICPHLLPLLLKKREITSGLSRPFAWGPETLHPCEAQAGYPCYLTLHPLEPLTQTSAITGGRVPWKFLC